MDTLLLDIETAPNLAYVWGLFKQNISPDHVSASSYVLCWTAKWHGQEKMHFDSVQRSGRKKMLQRIHTMLDRADVVVHYNGKKFDIPTLNKEFVIENMGPPSPYKQVDLYRTMKGGFRFESNKLDYIAKNLKIGEKVKHAGHELWVNCMAGKKDAWKQMEEYNRHDVELLERLYERLRPWIKGHPNIAAYEDVTGCPDCGSENYNARGFAITTTLKYQRFQCKDCGAWFRSHKTISLAKERFHRIAV